MMMVMAMLVGAWAGWLDRVTMQRLSMRRLPRCPGVQVSNMPLAVHLTSNYAPWAICLSPCSCVARHLTWNRYQHQDLLQYEQHIYVHMAIATFCTNNLSLTELLHYSVCTMHCVLCTKHCTNCKSWVRGIAKAGISSAPRSAQHSPLSHSAPICPSLGAIACRLISY